MRLSLTQISLTAVVALSVLFSSSTVTVSAAPAIRPTKYDGHRVIRINIQNQAQLDSLTAHEESLQLDYFTHYKVVGGNVDVRIAPEHFAEFQALNLDYNVQIDNLQASIEQETQENDAYQVKFEKARKSNARTPGQVFITADWFAGYHTYADHQTWLSTQISTYPTIASSFSAGKSFQGRPQAGIKIGSGPNHVVFHGTQHAREWITTMVTEWLADQLLKGTDTRVAGYLKKYTFHIIPIMNPDGFVITQTSNRMHRKNAQVNGGCTGTDTNRNWSKGWGTPGASTNPCADDYRGPSAFSSPEALNIANYLKSLPNVALYMDIHSYSQLIMTPWGYSATPPPNYNSFLKPLVQGAANALASVNGVRFTTGDIYNTIYPASGNSADYAYSIGVRAPLAVELRDTGRYGFQLPAAQIIPSGKEYWAAFAYMLDNLGV
ncbi:hypothetical protein BG015_012079 [Linnemannia schmuckeri]|uniref:Peptidase M14 domain-containing protein n=1 Tax=Linnemannia schmuckeri TaxID=64567 RepID=A0A9P5S6Y4_9FUNG|nr:hypothetical protein BG015_012079 [Linnemannia schmuckeri]